MSHRIPISAILLSLLALTLLVVAVLTHQGGEAVLAGPASGGPQKDWGWQ